MDFLEWQFLIFILPMLAAILYLLMMSVGVAWGGGADVDAGHDVHLDVGHDVDHDADVGHDTGEHGAHGPPMGVLGRVFGLLGVGKVPLSVLGLSICFIWGATGILLNVFRGLEPIIQNIALAALAALVGSRSIAEGLAKLLPREESYHTPKEELVGLLGEVLYEITRTSGTVRLSDPSGNLLDLDCRIQTDGGIKAGAKVVLQEYVPSTDIFFVVETTADRQPREEK